MRSQNRPHVRRVIAEARRGQFDPFNDAGGTDFVI